MNDWTTAVEIAKGGAQLIGIIIDLIHKALDGDDEAVTQLRRAEDILTPKSPTEEAFERVDAIADSKPSRGSE